MDILNSAALREIHQKILNLDIVIQPCADYLYFFYNIRILRKLYCQVICRARKGVKHIFACANGSGQRV